MLATERGKRSYRDFKRVPDQGFLNSSLRFDLLMNSKTIPSKRSISNTSNKRDVNAIPIMKYPAP